MQTLAHSTGLSDSLLQEEERTYDSFATEQEAAQHLVREWRAAGQVARDVPGACSLCKLSSSSAAPYARPLRP